jgi:Protein of unknown function (DUF998)
MTSAPRSLRVRAAALGGIIGPAAFVGAWVSGGMLTTRHYSPIDDAISRLAAIGNNTRPLMTAGFIGFGVALPVYASALRRTVSGPAWIAAAATGVSMLGVAATPLEHSKTIDALHAVAAGLGYATLAATPLLAARPLARQGHRMLATTGVIAGSLSAICLALTPTDLPTGLFQRVGLTTTDLWIAACAAAIASERI